MNEIRCKKVDIFDVKYGKGEKNDRLRNERKTCNEKQRKQIMNRIETLLSCENSYVVAG